ncbi:hypothetical protein HGRIS_001180 [Hohenbuehelia grisea]|uniref:Uncharacterized protein n=1 Tax=Hohenbuehelia grisea TaxID=104357 RepID=A0ABR3JNI2_9AGAR
MYKRTAIILPIFKTSMNDTGYMNHTKCSSITDNDIATPTTLQREHKRSRAIEPIPLLRQRIHIPNPRRIPPIMHTLQMHLIQIRPTTLRRPPHIPHELPISLQLKPIILLRRDVLRERRYRVWVRVRALYMERIGIVPGIVAPAFLE